MKKPLVLIERLTKHFKIGKKLLPAVQNVDLEIFQGETLGLVGESGCGKSTVGKLILRLEEPTSGKIHFNDTDLTNLSKKSMRPYRRRMQIVFQDPYASLNPRMTVEDIIGEPLDIHNLFKGKARHERIATLLDLVGLNPSHLNRFPHEFSGGQRQRIVIARALAVEPEFLICDEPISALDVSIQAQIVNLFKNLQKQMGLTYLFIAHDLSMIKYLSDRVAVMYLGHIVELAKSQDLYTEPLHPYTQALLSSIPIPDPQIEQKRKRIVLKGEVSIPQVNSPGCPFRFRCPLAKPICSSLPPVWKEVRKDHFAACHLL